MIRFTRKRLIVTAVVLSVLFGIGYVAWTLAGLPPVRFILRYGLSPGCEPTGETMTLEGVEFVGIGPGIFRMGSTHLAEGGDWLGRLCAPFGLPWGQKPKPSDEMPVHWVEFRRGFWIARTEVTNAQYERFDPEHKRTWAAQGDDDPVVMVSWVDAKRYCVWLRDMSGQPVRLPSESEWECACRAGSDSEFCFGDAEETLSKYAWYNQRDGGSTREVGSKLPNRWGLFDLHGNVSEWCEDAHHDSHDDAPCNGSARVVEGSPCHVNRGGGWAALASLCRSAARLYDPPARRLWTAGFRPACSGSGN